MNNRLNIVTEGDRSNSRPKGRDLGRTEAQAHFERLWLTDPEQFDTSRNIMERERITRTKTLLDSLPSIKTCIDLGVGDGVLTRFLADKGIEVTAVDVAKNALKRLEEHHNVTLVQDYVPDTKLSETTFDLVLSTDLIGFLKKNEYRLYVSELVRLSKHDGVIVCSTAIDIHSDDALSLFASLMETEIIIEEWVFSYHRLYIRTLQLLEKIKLSVLAKQLKKSRVFLNGCESISKAIWQKEGISHALFKGRKKPIMPLPKKSEEPIEHKSKRFVWE